MAASLLAPTSPSPIARSPPTMFFATNLGPAFGFKALEGHPKTRGMVDSRADAPVGEKGLAEMAEALAAMQRGGR